MCAALSSRTDVGSLVSFTGSSAGIRWAIQDGVRRLFGRFIGTHTCVNVVRWIDKIIHHLPCQGKAQESLQTFTGIKVSMICRWASLNDSAVTSCVPRYYKRLSQLPQCSSSTAVKVTCLPLTLDSVHSSTGWSWISQRSLSSSTRPLTTLSSLTNTKRIARFHEFVWSDKAGC